MAFSLAGLGAVAGGIDKGLAFGEDLQSKQLQKQAQEALGRAFMGGDGGLGGLGGLNQGAGPQPPSPGQASQPMQQPANQNFGPMSQTPPQPAQGQGVSMPGQATSQMMQATSSQESGGNYQTIGQKVTDKSGNTGNALGKYGIMSYNVPQWTKEVLGQSLTPAQFLGSSQAQDAVYKAKMGSYAQQYGTEGAGRAWLGGPGSVNNPGAKDALGTSVGSYGQNFAQRAGAQPGQGQPQPQQNQGPGHSQLMSMAQRIQKANPGIKPGVLWQALAQAAPMMNQEAQQALKEQTLDLRSQLQTQREQSELVLHQMDDFLKGQTSTQNTNTRAATQERGQDMQSADKAKALEVSKARLDMLKQWRDSTADMKAKAAVQQKLDQEQKNYVSLQRALTGAEASPTPDKAQVGQLKTDVDKAKPQDGPRNEDAPPPQPAAQASQPPQGLPPGAKEGDVVKSPSGQMFKVVNGKLAPVS